MFNNEIIQKHYKDIVQTTYEQLYKIPLPGENLGGMIRLNFMTWIGWLYLELTNINIRDNNSKRVALLYLKCFYTAAKYIFKKKENLELPGLGVTIKQMFEVMEQSQVAPYIAMKYEEYCNGSYAARSEANDIKFIPKLYNDIIAICDTHLNSAIDVFVKSEYNTDEYILSVSDEMFKDISKSVTDELQQQLEMATNQNVNNYLRYIDKYDAYKLKENFNISIYRYSHTNDYNIEQADANWYNNKVVDVKSNEVKINTTKENNKIYKNDKIEAIKNIQALMNIVEKQSKQIAELTSVIKTLAEHKE